MVRVLVTGSRGFVGRNLIAALRRRTDVEVAEHDLGSPPDGLATALATAEVIFHLAGVNRPEREADYASGNADFTAEVLEAIARSGRKPKVVLSSSIQAERDNAYGISKRRAEELLRSHCDRTGATGIAYRLKNLFGKWSRPNYNSVVATFCSNVANGLPIQISDPSAWVDLTYIDDVVASFVSQLDTGSEPGFRFAEPLPSHRIQLGDLAARIRGFHAHRATLLLPDFSTPFARALYATYLSYVPASSQGYTLDVKRDPRGSLAEFVKAPHFGQIFVSRTKPGVTRGNHYHHTKAEKFMVVEGEGIVRLRHIEAGDVTEFHVSGSAYQVVDIPPGYTHSIENVGTGEMVTLFWSSEVFDPARPDSYFAPVLAPAKDVSK